MFFSSHSCFSIIWKSELPRSYFLHVGVQFSSIIQWPAELGIKSLLSARRLIGAKVEELWLCFCSSDEEQNMCLYNLSVVVFYSFLQSQQKCIVIFALVCCFAVLVALIFSAVDIWGEDEDGITEENCSKDCRWTLLICKHTAVEHPEWFPNFLPHHKLKAKADFFFSLLELQENYLQEVWKIGETKKKLGWETLHSFMLWIISVVFHNYHILTLLTFCHKTFKHFSFRLYFSLCLFYCITFPISQL